MAFVTTIALLSGWGSAPQAQTHGFKEDFTATAILNNDLGSGAGRVDIHIDRWSTEAEREKLVTTLRQKGPEELFDELQDMRPVGTIKTPDSLAYDLRYSHQQPGKDGGRSIILATDRPVTFWEAANRPRSYDYPFVVIQMEIAPNGEGKGTLAYATKITAVGKNTIVLENFGTAPIMLADVKATKSKD